MAELDPKLYTVVWLAPLRIEALAALHLLDHKHEGNFPVGPGDDFVYEAGDMSGHNIIIATFPLASAYGTCSAAALASQTKMVFPNLQFGLLVGIAGGLPNHSLSPPRDVRLGDVLVGRASGDTAAFVAYDAGTETEQNGLRLGPALAETHPVVLKAIDNLRNQAPDDTKAFMKFYKDLEHKKHPKGNFADPGHENDTLFKTDGNGKESRVAREPRPDSRRSLVWYGPIGSGDTLMKNARKRDLLRDQYDLIGVEMEAAGTMNTIPMGVIRGVSDYADKHKNKIWQPYAAATAAAYAKAILAEIPPKKV